MIKQYPITLPSNVLDNIAKLRNMSTPRLRSNVLGWQSDQYTNFETIPWAEELFNNCITTANLKNPLEHIWININSPKSFNRWHGHPNTDIVCVLYIQVPKNSGNIELRGKVKASITPYSGLLLLFPGDVEHRVTVNNSTEDRISLAFNLGPLT